MYQVLSSRVNWIRFPQIFNLSFSTGLRLSLMMQVALAKVFFFFFLNLPKSLLPTTVQYSQNVSCCSLIHTLLNEALLIPGSRPHDSNIYNNFNTLESQTWSEDRRSPWPLGSWRMNNDVAFPRGRNPHPQRTTHQKLGRRCVQRQIEWRENSTE